MPVFSNSNPFDFQGKTEPGSWITWLAGPMTDPSACLLPLYLQSRTVVPKDDNADLGDWATKHGLLMEETAEQLRSRGRTVLLEQPIAVTSKTGVIVSGSMDLWAEEDPDKRQQALVIDAKTGKQRPHHRAQVNLYQLLTTASPDFQTTGPVAGGLVYGDGARFNIPADEASPALKAKLGQLLEVVAGDIAPDPAPSSNNCRFCRIREWCPSAASGRAKPPAVVEF